MYTSTHRIGTLASGIASIWSIRAAYSSAVLYLPTSLVPIAIPHTSGSTPSEIIVNNVLTPDSGSALPSPTAIRLLTSASMSMSVKP